MRGGAANGYRHGMPKWLIVPIAVVVGIVVFVGVYLARLRDWWKG
jgi:uncharacterized membrane protein YqiK